MRNIFIAATSLFSFREYLSLVVGHTVVQDRPGDQFLVSYPRSGNTWMRTMLAYLINPAAENNPDLRKRIIPGISIRRFASINKQPSPRIIKSHTWYRKDIPRAVYLVRDGRDVMVSLYHYHITRKGKTMSFPEFFDAYIAGRFGQRWHTNVESWLLEGQERLRENLLVLKFEDLKRDTLQGLAKTAQFLRIPTTDELLSRAIQVAELSNVRKVEWQRKGSLQDNNESFYRGGRTGEWQEYLDSRMNEIYLKDARKALSVAGYR